MAQTNTRTHKPAPVTHGGTIAARITPEQQLRRSICACLLWENSFYEDGVTIADRIAGLVPKVPAKVVADLAVEARTDHKLRHAPLLLVREMLRHPEHKKLAADTIEQVIQRADELPELLSLYWKEGKTPISAQLKKGLARAFTKFDAYQLAKYNRERDIRLRDVLFLSHARPRDKKQEAVWQQLIEGTLPIPDTWETNLSSGADKRATFERLIAEKKLGALALLRNIRNMTQAGVPTGTITSALTGINAERILPFQFITAAKYNPQFEPALEVGMLKCLSTFEKLKGKTALVVDVSGSMMGSLSDKGEMTRMDAAMGVAMLARELCEDPHIFTFADKTVRVAPRRGFSLRDAIWHSQGHGWTDLGGAVNTVNKEDFDRVIVFTDEQSQTRVAAPKAHRAYMINVACYQHGLGYKEWVHIDGFSESTLKWIHEFERSF